MWLISDGFVRQSKRALSLILSVTFIKKLPYLSFFIGFFKYCIQYVILTAVKQELPSPRLHAVYCM